MNGGDEAEQAEDLDEAETDEHGRAQLARHLGLARHALDRLAEQDAQTDAGADGGEAVADDREVAGDRPQVWFLSSARRSARPGWGGRRHLRAGQSARSECLSVLRLDRHLQVHRGEDDEHVRLQCGDEDLEQEEREPAERGSRRRATLSAGRGWRNEERRRREAQDEQQVPGHHVGDESDGQRRRPQQEDLQELDRRQQRCRGTSARPGGNSCPLRKPPTPSGRHRVDEVQ